MQLTSGYESRRARIEMVPLLDAIFLLMIFFIYAMMSMSETHGVRLTLPRAAGAPELRAGNMVITINADNSIAIDKNPCSMDEAVRIAVARAAEGSGKVLVCGDRRADLGIAVELLSRLRGGGVDQVSFLVEKTAGTVGNTE